MTDGTAELPFEIDLQAFEALPPDVQQEELGRIEAVRELVAANPLWRFLPHSGEAGYRAKHGLPLSGKESRGQIEFLELDARGIYTGAVVAGNRFGKCLREGTLVRMWDGTARAIEAVQPGEWVVGVNLDGTTRPARVLERIDQGAKDAWRHEWGKRGASASFDATMEHRMLARPESGTNRIAAAGAAGGRWVAQRHLGFDPGPSDDPDEEHALLAGLLIGDGCLIGRTPQFACADDDILALATIEAERLGCRLAGNSANPIQYRMTQPREAWAVAVKGANPVKALAARLGFACRAEHKTIPAAAWTWSNAAVARLLAGLILTDGSVTRCDGVGCVSFASVSRPLVEGVKRLMEERFGVYGSEVCEAQRDGRSTEYSWSVRNYASVVRLAQAIPLVGAKRDRLDALVESWPGKHSDGAGLVWRGRRHLGRAPTWDIVIDHPTHLFALANGLVVSNTHIAVARAAIQTLPAAMVPPWLLPYKTLDPDKRDVRYIFAGPDSTNWLSKTFLPKVRQLLPPEALYRGDVDSAYNAKDRILRFDDGSYWNVLTYDMELKAWAGQEADGVNFDEEPAGPGGYLKYEEAVGRIIDRDGTLRFTLTPVFGIGWLYEILADENGNPRQDSETHVVTGNIDHNPNLPDSAREKAKKVWRRRPSTALAREQGLWTHREGLIFPEFEPELEQPPDSELSGGHYRMDRDLIAPDGDAGGHPCDHTGRWLVPVFEVIDPGINEDHPFAFSVSFLNNAATDVYGQPDVLETFYAFKAPDLDVGGQAAVVHDARARFGYRPAFTRIDPAARNRNPETGRRLQDAWRKEGIWTQPGQNDRALTYDAIHQRLSTHRWVIWASLAPLLGDELLKYRWKGNRGRTDDAPKPEPIKRNDDLIDTIRYLMVGVDVYLGQRPDPDEETDPKKRLLNAALDAARGRRGRKHGKVAGVW